MRSLFARLRNLSFNADRRRSPSLVGIAFINRNSTPRKVPSQFETLPQEIHERILSSLPDFASLRNVVYTCTTLWNACILRRKFIIDAVIRSDVGHEEGLLEYALALSRYIEDGDGGQVAFLRDINNRSSSYWNEELQPGEAKRVAALSKTVRELEI